LYRGKEEKERERKATCSYKEERGKVRGARRDREGAGEHGRGKENRKTNLMQHLLVNFLPLPISFSFREETKIGFLI